MLNKGKKFAGFNFFAFLFGECWCVYRKLYLLGAMILLLSVLVAIGGVQLYVQFYDNSFQGKRYAVVCGILMAMLLVRIPLGLLANRLYLNKAKADIQSFIDQKLPAEYFNAQLKAAGGINVGGFFAVICLQIILAELLRY